MASLTINRAGPDMTKKTKPISRPVIHQVSPGMAKKMQPIHDRLTGIGLAPIPDTRRPGGVAVMLFCPAPV